MVFGMGLFSSDSALLAAKLSLRYAVVSSTFVYHCCKSNWASQFNDRQVLVMLGQSAAAG
jgi:hypothetical protein